MSESAEVEGEGTAVAGSTLLSNSITYRRGRRRCDIGILNPMTFRAGSHLSSLLPKKVAPIRAII